MSKSSIEWTQHTWNPIRGCSRISPGCKHCYAERTAARNLPGMRSPTTHQPFAIMGSDGPHWTGKVELIESMLDIPLRRRIPTTYFVNSMSDLFHEALPDESIDRIFAVMALCPQHTFQILTKRADRMWEYLSAARERLAKRFWIDVTILRAAPVKGIRAAVNRFRSMAFDESLAPMPWPLPNVWLGVSVENQECADERIPLLLKTPAAIRFISAEPLLGPLCIGRYLHGHEEHGIDLARPAGSKVGCTVGYTPPLDWVICGGESGPGARPCQIEWLDRIAAECESARVPCFVKQLGSNPRHGAFKYSCESDRTHGRDPEDWPRSLRVREMPEVLSRA